MCICVLLGIRYMRKVCRQLVVSYSLVKINGRHHAIHCFYAHPCHVFNEFVARFRLKDVLATYWMLLVRGKLLWLLVAFAGWHVVIDEQKFIKPSHW